MKDFFSLLLASTLVSCPIFAQSSIETIQAYHLETAEGRNSFLEEKFIPFAFETNQLHLKIQEQAEKIQQMHPVAQQKAITALTREMTENMEHLNARLELLQKSFWIERDFSQIDQILSQKEPLTEEQQTILDRLAAICIGTEL